MKDGVERSASVPSGVKASEVVQRHADYYIGFLMNQGKKPRQIYKEMGQIALAMQRVKQEDVGVKNFHPGLVEVRFKEFSGGFANIYLGKLVEGKYKRKDLDKIATAVSLVESGEVEGYPVNATTLKNLFEQAREKFAKK